jgi:hypothetical protein
VVAAAASARIRALRRPIEGVRVWWGMSVSVYGSG